MEALAAFFLEIWNSYLLLSPFERLGGAIGVVLPVATPVWLFTWRKMRGGKLSAIAVSKRDRETRISAEAKRDDVIDQLKLARKECETAERENATTALALFEKEMNDGNSIKGLHVLNDHFLENRPTLSKMAVELAKLHALRGDMEEPEYYVHGLRFANLAIELDKKNKIAISLAAELAEEVRIESDAGRVDAENIDLDAPGDFLVPATREEKEVLASKLYSMAIIQQHKRQYTSALLHVRRCLRVHKVTISPSNPIFLTARYLEAEILNNLKQHQRAFDLIKTVIVDETQVFGFKHRSTLISRNLETRILTNLERYQKALDKIQALIIDQTIELGPTDRNTLVSRHLEVMNLRSLGQKNLARSKLQKLMPLEKKVLGDENADVKYSSSMLKSLLEEEE